MNGDILLFITVVEFFNIFVYVCSHVFDISLQCFVEIDEKMLFVK